MSVSKQGFASSMNDIDFSGIENVVVEGSDSRLDVTTHKDGASALRISKDGWGDSFCNPTVNYERDNTTLRIRVGQSGVRTGLPGQCNITVAVDMPENLNLSVLQASAVANVKGLMKDVSVKGDNAVVTINGSVNDLNINSHKTVVTFSGAVRILSIHADKAVAELTLNSAVSPQSLSIDAAMLVTNIGLPDDTEMEHSVEAPIAMFSNPFKNTVGAKLKIDIRSQMLKGSLYSVQKATHS
nr:hypothetical protein [uncultured Gellertiella sp.]